MCIRDRSKTGVTGKISGIANHFALATASQLITHDFTNSTPSPCLLYTSSPESLHDFHYAFDDIRYMLLPLDDIHISLKFLLQHLVSFLLTSFHKLVFQHHRLIRLTVLHQFELVNFEKLFV